MVAFGRDPKEFPKKFDNPYYQNENTPYGLGVPQLLRNEQVLPTKKNLPPFFWRNGMIQKINRDISPISNGKVLLRLLSSFDPLFVLFCCWKPERNDDCYPLLSSVLKSVVE